MAKGSFLMQPLFGGGKVASNYEPLARGGAVFPKPHTGPPGLAEGGDVEEEGGEGGGEYDCTPEEKLAAADVMDAVKSGSAEKMAQALKGFFMLAESSPHDEG